jgi:hypothetical protein
MTIVYNFENVFKFETSHLTKYRVGSGAIPIPKRIFINNKTRFLQRLLLTCDFQQNYGARFIALLNTNFGA